MVSAHVPSRSARAIIPIKLEISASVGFIHKEFVTIHGRTIVKCMKVSYIIYTVCLLHVSAISVAILRGVNYKGGGKNFESQCTSVLRFSSCF